MTYPINPFRLQTGPAAFALVCVYGVFVALRQLIETRIGTEAWWTGVVLLVMIVCGFAFVEGVWLYAQREVAFTNEDLVVRRWIAVVFNRPGRQLALGDVARSAVLIEDGRLRVERDGAVFLNMQLLYWGRKHVLALVRAFEERGISVDVRWPGAVPV